MGIPDYSPALELREAKYFLLGLEKSLFCIGKVSHIQSDFLPNPPKQNDWQRMIQLFWRQYRMPKWRLYREGVCQMATASYLSIHHNWSVPEIVMEPDIKNYGDLTYAADILVKESEDTVAICCEVKSNKR